MTTESDGVSSRRSQYEYIIGGVTVHFPFKAYPSQIMMMSKIIQALQTSKNALLESPTGTGKSLALLCAVLAWQQQETKKIADLEREFLALSSDLTESDEEQPQETKDSSKKTEEKKKLIKIKSEDNINVTIKSLHDDAASDTTATNRKLAKRSNSILINDDDDFQPSKLARANTMPPPCDASTEERTDESDAEEGTVITLPSTVPATVKRTVPKIYFGSRTHRQLAQIVKELGTTVYRPRMAVLGSRDQYCIHKTVSKAKNKTEECFDTIEHGGCHYFQQSQKQKKRGKPHFLDDVWDIEDLVSYGEKHRVCPYFTARDIASTAEIIFCPYNYLVDPIVRESMAISLQDSIVILDEAHNIEDVARDSATVELALDDLEMILHQIDYMIEEGTLVDQHQLLRLLVQGWLNWTNDIAERDFMHKSFEKHTNIWNGQEILTVLSSFAMTAATFPRLQLALSSISEHVMESRSERMSDHAIAQDDADERAKRKGGLGMTITSVHVLESLLNVMQSLFHSHHKYYEDYHLVVIKEAISIHDDKASNRRKKSWGHAGLSKVWQTRLGFWCLNPAVTFHRTSDEVRSIVLTSGTLSPMDTFASELGTEFSIRAEALHIIDKQQVWVGVLPVGPQGSLLSGVYRNAETLSYQDDIGESLLHILRLVPHGVLCFVPSYNILEKLQTRWKSTGLWQQLALVKELLTEPRASDKREFEAVMKRYYAAIAKSTQKENTVPEVSVVEDVSEPPIANNWLGTGASFQRRAATTNGDTQCVSGKGALLMAVCRGKVSEGLDFVDDHARAVISIGIPYPNVKDMQVDCKRKYNDRCCKSKNLLNGHQWYDTQAFRAMNQALGRCIRHRNDWGAIILLEERFTNQRNVNFLSKWVRQRVEQFDDFRGGMQSLKAFTDYHVEKKEALLAKKE